MPAAALVSSTWEWTPIFSETRRRWVLTVCGEMNSCPAISRLVSPRVANRATCRSVGVSDGRAGAGHPDVPAEHRRLGHDLPADSLANVDADTNYVRVQVLTNAGALDRDKQLAVVARLTEIIAAAAGDPTLAERIWVLLTEAPEGGWGLWGHAHTNAELVTATRNQIAQLSGNA